MYGGYGAKGSPDMGKMITDWHCDRVKKLIDTSKGTILTGGKVDRGLKYVEPTIIVNPALDSPVMQEEIFGPVLPVVTFAHIDEAVRLINSKDKALAVYYFGAVKDKNSDILCRETSSGAFLVNEAVVHIINHEFGFGGVGQSGYGRYGGYDGFKQWSNPKSIMIKPTMNFPPYNSLAPPFTAAKEARLRLLFKMPGTQNKALFLLKTLLALTAMYYLLQCSCFQQSVKTACNQYFQ